MERGMWDIAVGVDAISGARIGLYEDDCSDWSIFDIPDLDWDFWLSINYIPRQDTPLLQQPGTHTTTAQQSSHIYSPTPSDPNVNRCTRIKSSLPSSFITPNVGEPPKNDPKARHPRQNPRQLPQLSQPCKDKYLASAHSRRAPCPHHPRAKLLSWYLRAETSPMTNQITEIVPAPDLCHGHDWRVPTYA